MEKITRPEKITKKWFREVYMPYYEIHMAELNEIFQRGDDPGPWCDDVDELWDERKELQWASLTKLEKSAKTWHDPNLEHVLAKLDLTRDMDNVCTIELIKSGNSYEAHFNCACGCTYTIFDGFDRADFVLFVLSFLNLRAAERCLPFGNHHFCEDKDEDSWEITLLEDVSAEETGRCESRNEYKRCLPASTGKKQTKMNHLLEKLYDEGYQIRLAILKAQSKMKKKD
jgi:hypothetical protein